jgi:HEAT repeat protein
LGNIKDPKAVEPLIAKLDDTNQRVQSAAALALVNMNIKDPRLCYPLYEILIADAGSHQSDAASALAGMKDEPIAIELLHKAAKHPRPVVRIAAERALGLHAERIRNIRPSVPRRIHPDDIPRRKQTMDQPRPSHRKK